MAFGAGFGRNDRADFGGPAGSASGLGGVSDPGFGNAGFDRADFGGDGGGSSSGDSFFERQRRRSDPSGFGAGPKAGAPSPEVGGSEQRHSAVEEVQLEHGSLVAALARRDIFGVLDLVERRVSNQLGITQHTTVDQRTGFFGPEGKFQPLSLLGNLSLGVGVSAAVQALNMLGPASATKAVLDATGQARALDTLAGYAPSVDLGFQPSPGTTRRAKAARVSGRALTAADQLALDFVDRRDAAIAARARSREAGRGDPQNNLVSRVALAPAAPRAPAAPAAPGPRGFGRLSGRDPSLDLDLLRTGEQAAVAAGLAPARPRIVSVRSPAPPGALI